MEKFLHALSPRDIAEQIAGLINTYNNLSFQRTPLDILDGKTNYIVETHGKKVIGTCGIHRLNYQLTELKHLVVIPPWRRKGVGVFLVKSALQNCTTPLLYATVRRDNAASIRLFESLGFQVSTEYNSDGHAVAMLVRASPKWTEAVPSWKQVSSLDQMPPISRE